MTTTYPRGALAIAADLDLLINELAAIDIDVDVLALEDVRDELRAEVERQQVEDDKEAARLMRAERFNQKEFL